MAARRRTKTASRCRTTCFASTDKNFRPVDPQIGPDGALWFGDWCNALIGHMQYSQRDPNRDHQRGRIYRLVYTKNKLLEPVTQYGKSEAELLDQLREYEPRTRYRARRELRDRPTDVVAGRREEMGRGARPERSRIRSAALRSAVGAAGPSCGRRRAAAAKFCQRRRQMPARPRCMSWPTKREYSAQRTGVACRPASATNTRGCGWKRFAA